MRSLIALCVSAIAFLALLPVSAKADARPLPSFWDDKEYVVKPDLGEVSRIRFLTTVDFPPFSFLDARQKLVGFNIDLVRKLCGLLETEQQCEIQALPFDELVSSVKSKQGEAIVAGLSPSAELRAQLLFSRPYLQLPARFVVKRQGRPDLADGSFPPAGMRIGVLRNSAHERLLRSYFPGVRAVTYDREDWLLSDLKSGNIQAVFGDAMRLSFWIGGADSQSCCTFELPPFFAPEYLGPGMMIAVDSKRPELADAINYALKSLEKEGVMSELYLRYFPVGFY